MRNSIMFIIAFAGYVFISQAATGKYFEELRKYYKEFGKLARPTVPGKVHYFSYEETMNLRNPEDYKKPSYKLASKVYVSVDKFCFFSNDMEVFQDDKDAFLVVHPLKQVFRSHAFQSGHGKERLENYLEQQDRILKNSKVLEEKVMDINGVKHVKIVLKHSEEDSKEIMVDKTIYWYDLDHKKIWKTEVFYLEPYELKSKVTVYKDLDFDHASKMKKPVFKQVMNNKGQLTAEYKNYKLVDNRK